MTAESKPLVLIRFINFSLFSKRLLLLRGFKQLFFKKLIGAEGRDSYRMSGTVGKAEGVVQPRQAKGRWAKKALFAFRTI
jgi:hypothetical protein